MRFVKTTTAIVVASILAGCNTTPSIECDAENVKSHVIDQVSNHLGIDQSMINVELMKVNDLDINSTNIGNCSAFFYTEYSKDTTDKINALTKEVQSSIKLDANGFPITKFVPGVDEMVDIDAYARLPYHIKLAVLGSGYMNYAYQSYKKQLTEFYGNEGLANQIVDLATNLKELAETGSAEFTRLTGPLYITVNYTTQIIKEDGKKKLDVDIKTPDDLSELEDRAKVARGLKNSAKKETL